jgi:hypothetical protein
MKSKGWLVVGVLAACLAGLEVGRRWGGAAPAEKDKAQVIDAGRFASLQEALDAVPEAGGEVRIPPGDYELKEPLVLTRENVLVRGSGAATHLINRNAEGKPALVLRPRERATKPRERIWRVQVMDLRISGNPKSGDGLLAEGVNEVFLQGVSIDHNGGHGIRLVDCYEDPRIIGCILTYNGKSGLHILRTHDIVVSANQFEENLDALTCIDSFNLCMTGNNLDDHLRHGVVIENTYGSVLSGNMIEECKGTAVVMDRDCYGITISANVFAHNGGGGVHLRDAWGCAVSANTFTIDDGWSVWVHKDSGRIAITGNNFSNSNIGGKTRRATDDPATGVKLDGTPDVVLSGNVFTGMARMAIVAEGNCPRLVVTGNAMADLYRKAPAGGPALVLPDKVPGAVIADNAIEEKGGGK